ncbi:filamin-binding LIM protein 1 [Carettochelys insculpta]|uniref:filamin-binding LIM protein 1 n=1 Tax=Carettochelys insculpta TaxID=44489 RepID=UPI003EB77B4D
MLSGKVEKRVASSIYITLAPPRRDMVVQGDTRPEVHQRSQHHPKEAANAVGTQQPHVSPSKSTPNSSCPASKQSSRTLGSAGPSSGAGGWSNRGFASVPCPLLPDVPAGSDLESPLLSPPPYRLLVDGPDALSAETLHPGLQKLNVSSPGSRQASSTFPAEPRQHKIQPTRLEQADEHQAEKQNMNGHLERDMSTVCAFCHKAIAPRTPTIEAMNRQYHVDCFTCRTCHSRLAGQHYYQKAGRPLCNTCYEDTLEKCAKCQAVILDHIVRALGNGYHPECFTCSVCCRSIGDETFAVDDQNEVHCVDDFYRKYASVCNVCETPIIPQDGKDAYRIECMGRNFHESCYRCENCGVPLSPEPEENGCYPLDSHIFCKSCHIKQKNESSC